MWDLDNWLALADPGGGWCTPVADAGFPIGGCGLPRWLHFENFVCQNERIWTLRGEHQLGMPPLHLPMQQAICEQWWIQGAPGWKM